jgi:transcriptional regulator with GAF, ATPase, and Fis domain
MTNDDNAREALVYELGNMFAAQLGLEELIPLVISKCREVLDAGGVSVLLLDAERSELYFPYVSEENPEAAQRLRDLRVPAGSGLAGAALLSGQAEKIDDPQSDPRFYSGADKKTGVTTRSLLVAPLIAEQERLGVIEAVNPHGRASFSDADLGLLKKLAVSIAVAVQNARRFREVKDSAQQLQAQIGVLRRDLLRRDRFTEIIAVSRAMAEVFRLMEAAALSPIPVLIEGETGTGKELVARGIHRASSRAEAPFVAINCAALPEALLESELFGHRRGAFTGATEDQPGLFRAAKGGVVFLDEIGEMPLAMQAKLLRVVQENEVTSVGDTRPSKVDVRVISATNRDLKEAQAARAFRQDLFYRLSAFPIRLPPLRERREDIPFLAARFLEQASERHNKQLGGFHPSAIELLGRAEWPGNVRELQNEIERAVALAREGETLTTAHLSLSLTQSPEPAVKSDGVPTASAQSGERGSQAIASPRQGSADESPTSTKISLQDAREAYEARYISQVLAEHGGNVSHAAVALRLSRVALQKKMKRYGLR